MKRKYIYLSIAIIVFIILIVSGVLVFNNKTHNTKSIDETNSNEVINEDVYLVVSINPKIMLRINNDTIIEVFQLNDDAVIFTNNDLKGLELENGIKRIIDIATQYDYIDGDTEIRLGTYNYKDNESGELKENVLGKATTHFIENGVRITPFSISNKEAEEILDILKDYSEKTKEITSDDHEEDNNSDNSTSAETTTNNTKPSNSTSNSNKNNNTTKPSNNTTSSNNSTSKPSNSTSSNASSNNSNSNNNQSNTNTSNNNNASTNTTTNNNSSTENKQPTTPTKLDINNVYGSYGASVYKKVEGTNWDGYNSPKAYFNDMTKKCNNNTILEVYPWLSNPDASKHQYRDLTSACSEIKRINSKMDYDWYYKDSVRFDITKEEGLVSYCSGIAFVEPISSGGGKGCMPSFDEVTITSDTSKYYIEFDYNGVGKVKCSAGTNLKFTCDKALAKDDYTGANITTVSKIS